MFNLTYMKNSKPKDVYADSIEDYQKSVNHITEYQNLYKYVADPALREVISYADTDMSSKNVFIKENIVNIIKEQYYERKNGSVLLILNRIRKKKFIFDDAEIKIRYIEVIENNTEEEKRKSDQRSYLKIAKVKFNGCYIQSDLLPMRRRKKGETIKHLTERIVLRGQTFLLKENSSEEPIDCMRAKNEQNPYNKTKLFTTVYIPVNAFDSLEEMQKNIKKGGRLSTEELKELLSDIK